ncbi:restriction endonuclease subunit S [Curtobacterium sp. UNCCL17]|uniref:restriction endonuclease subunit S n=1 Tax=Curtobacterium sp. UNCCL17 TaxID=1449051 RepID=UPI0009E04A6C|nr:restriction endonuclease subunit S [Curtobacterium sp. UNCCL17]
MVETQKLGDIAEMRLGLQATVHTDGVMPMVRVGDLRNVIEWPNVGLTAAAGATEDDLALRDGDVLIARSGDGSVGNSALVTDPPLPTTFASYVIRVRLSTSVDPRFFAYWLKSDAGNHQIRERIVGSPISNLSVERLSTMMVPVPSLEIQRRIGQEAHDGYLLVQRAKESVAAASARVSEIRIASHPIWAQLQSTNVEVMPLSEITRNRDRDRVALNAATRRDRPGGTPYYGASGVIDRVSGHTHRGEHVLVSEDGNNLRTRRLPIAFVADGEFWANNHVHVLDPDITKVSAAYVALAIDAQDLSPLLTGSAQPKLNQRSLNGLSIMVPSLPQQAHIVERCNRFLEQVAEMASLCKDAETAIEDAWRGLLRRHYNDASEAGERSNLEEAEAQVRVWLDRIRDLNLRPTNETILGKAPQRLDEVPDGFVSIEVAFDQFRSQSDSEDLDDSVDSFFDWVRYKLAQEDAVLEKKNGKTYIRIES